MNNMKLREGVDELKGLRTPVLNKQINVGFDIFNCLSAQKSCSLCAIPQTQLYPLARKEHLLVVV